jgi:NitT/TauT family transport system permease protein
LLIVGIWTYLSATVAKDSGVIPTPWDTVRLIAAESQKKYFYAAVFGTLTRSFFSFLISFTAAAVLAVLSNLQRWIKRLIDPLITVCRALPTAAIILILLLCVGGKALPVAVAFLVVFPLSYQNLYAAIEGTDKNLLQMADVFRVSAFGRVFGVYLPGVTPAAFSSAIAAFGLNIKVVIAAEVLGLPSVSVGYMILISKQGFDFDISFAWLVIAVLMSFACECVLRMLARLAMPYKYNDRRNVKRAFAWTAAWCKRAAARLPRRGKRSGGK